MKAGISPLAFLLLIKTLLREVPEACRGWSSKNSTRRVSL